MRILWKTARIDSVSVGKGNRSPEIEVVAVEGTEIDVVVTDISIRVKPSNIDIFATPKAPQAIGKNLKCVFIVKVASKMELAD